MTYEQEPITIEYVAFLAEQQRLGTLPPSHLQDPRVQQALAILNIPGVMNGQFDTRNGTHLDAEDRLGGIPTEKPNK